MSHKSTDEEVFKISNIYSSKQKLLADSSLDKSCALVKEAFLKLAADNPNDYDKCDIERVKSVDFTVKRFVLTNDLDFDKSLKQLDQTMKWRKKFGVNVKTEKDAPAEFFQSGALFHMGVDRNGLPVIYFRAKTVVKIKKLQPIIQLMVINVMNKIDFECNGNGFVFVMDMNEVGLKNADLDLIQYVIDIGRNYFPMGISRIIVLNTPWYLKSLVPVVKMWLSADEQAILKFASGAELFRFIDKEYVPTYLGGSNATDFTVVPEGCKPCVQICHNYGITRDEAKDFMVKYQPIIEEAKSLVNKQARLKGLKNAKIEDQNNNNDMIQSLDKMFIQIPI